MFVIFISLLHKIRKMNTVEISYMSHVSLLKLVFYWNPVSGFCIENCMLCLWSCILVIYHPYLTQSSSWTLVDIWVIVYCVENINVDIRIYTFNFTIIYGVLQLPRCALAFMNNTGHICHFRTLCSVPLHWVLIVLGLFGISFLGTYTAWNFNIFSHCIRVYILTMYIEFFHQTHLLLVKLVCINFMFSYWSFLGGKYCKGDLLWYSTLFVLVASAAPVFRIEGWLKNGVAGSSSA